MRELNQNEMEQIQGGAVNWAIVAGVGTAISFVIGVIDGYINPLKCNNK